MYPDTATCMLQAAFVLSLIGLLFLIGAPFILEVRASVTRQHVPVALGWRRLLQLCMATGCGVPQALPSFPCSLWRGKEGRLTAHPVHVDTLVHFAALAWFCGFV